MRQHLREYAVTLLDLKLIWKPALAFWGIFLAIWIFISVSRLGFQQDVVGLSWGPAGTPITFLQVIAVMVCSIFLTALWQLTRSRIQRIPSLLILDIVIVIALWAIAVVLWSNEPSSATHFSPPPMPPNREIYPNSDALVYDKASYHLLYGIGFTDRLTRRPLYVGMLTLFHALAGPNYDKTIFLQILFLAFIPPLVFMLTSKLSSRTAGLIAGGLILLREQNSISLSKQIVTSHAKLMMSDMVTTLGVILVLYLAVSWLFKEKKGILNIAIIGACLGLTALVRTQVLIILVPLIFFMLLFSRSVKVTAMSSLSFILGIILVMVPWVWRNWNLTGTFVLDDRGEERLLARNYSLSPLSLPPALPGETEQEFSARLKSEIFTFVRTHPGDVAHFVSNHFLRNLATGSVYVAPAYSDASPSEIVKHLPFWGNWNGELTRNSRAALFLNLGILAFGVGVGVKKNKWTGLLPLVVFLLYSFGNALVRSSGWRFNQPADWIILIYYSMALAYLPSRFKAIHGRQTMPEPAEKINTSVHHLVPKLVILFTLFLLGASVPIAERLIPSREYGGFTEDAKEFLTKENIISAAELNAFLMQDKTVLISGIALYPRYVTTTSRFHPLESSGVYNYLHFRLIDENDQQVVLPIRSVPNIPHTSTLSILGCEQENYISAFAVIVHTSSNELLFRDPQVSLQCPLPEPEE